MRTNYNKKNKFHGNVTFGLVILMYNAVCNRNVHL